MTFQFDTSGVVVVLDAPGTLQIGPIVWSDLDPFTQGYVEALFAHEPWGDDSLKVGNAHFSRLAPETLARIMEDCAEFAARVNAIIPAAQDATSGAAFWALRQREPKRQTDFPPLTPYLGDDGRVYLREQPPHE